MSIKKISIGVVVSDFNNEITNKMLEAVQAQSKDLEVDITETIHVPGAFDMSLAVKKLFQKKTIDAVVVLGVVIEGQTDHDKVIVNTIAYAFTNLSLEFEKPIGFGIIGPKVSWTEAKERAESYAKRALKTAVSLFNQLQ